MNFNFMPELLVCLSNSALGIIHATVKVEKSNPDLIRQIDESLNIIKKTYSLDQVNSIENINHARNAYKKTGGDPNRYRPSADSLIRRIVKGMGIYYINNVVDVLNLISIRTGISIGGYDLDKIKGEITMGIGKHGDVYTGIGRGVLNITNLPVLLDNFGAFGSPTSDSERTMITGKTQCIIFVFFDFGLSPLLESYLNECIYLLKIYCFSENPEAIIITPH
jgi:DNA/RNA-binding domain of Phe-tRNA-synthetase-like protein